MTKALFLCTEPSGYLINCVRMLAAERGVEVKMYHWDVARNAPFTIEAQGLALIHKSKVSSADLIKNATQFGPTVVYVATWRDKEYRKLARIFTTAGIPVILGLDNPWTGNLRQRLLCILSGWLLRPFYSQVWTAGTRQMEFARRLGYNSNDILTGLYCADVNCFNMATDRQSHKRLLFVGRLEKVKGVVELWNVFNSLSESERNDWTLTIVGNGSYWNRIKSSESVTLKAFMQPQELALEMAQSGCLILPSLKEPWGVVVHEAAAAGLPLIISDAVSSGEEYLIQNYNGYRFRSSDQSDLKRVLVRFFSLSSRERLIMGNRSKVLALRYTPGLWSARFLSVSRTDNFIGKEQSQIS